MDFQGTSIGTQILLAIITVAVIFFVYMVFETLYRAYLAYGKARITVYPYTGSSSKAKIFRQDPTNPQNVILPLSENQLTGIEFSYSCFLYISDESDLGQEGWTTVFYKGYESSAFPLLGPGVFVKSDNSGSNSPCLRVIMNTYDNWFNTIDINQIPYNKWFHLAIVLRRNTMELYVNGNLANKKTFYGTLPYQNYEPLILFPSVRTTASEFSNSNGSDMKKGIPPGDNFVLNGKFAGYLSSLYYFSYAISYAEIQGLLNMGPSSEFDQGSMDKPPYLIDSWWTSRGK